MPRTRAAAAGRPADLGSFRAAIRAEQRVQAALAQSAVARAPDLATDEIVNAVDTGALARAMATPLPDPAIEPAEVDEDAGVRQATQCARAAADVWRWRWPLESVRSVRWEPLGTVIPVLGASPGAGSSVVAAALADQLQFEGHRRVMLADTADPVRSGLAGAAWTEGSWTRGPHPLVRVRFSFRGAALLGRLDTDLPLITHGMVPSPPWWRYSDTNVSATVVDVAHDAWRVAANPLVGAGAWMRNGTPSPRPVLVCKPSSPSLRAADLVISRLDAWASMGAIAPVEHLVVVGGRRWPPGVAGVASRRLAPLVEHAVFVPYDREIAARGVTDRLTPPRVRRALRPLLEGFGLTDTASDGDAA